ncbi:acyl-homoserine-lactone synthase [Novosphingobium sp. JCM 18896]|uniref:acyl-homoserine-lactone synthase n=1 Tax=Novosphingobium sp. JCM 18896 TaxID=2989731 RepID=UPI0022218913|nr:acyl-homoserine-lactone synthase [Novosphingobium sp. JCM 18896]MCW1430392.1 autoinducer synthase [Novosphingobium sp. JCM 18896]
MIQHLTRSDRAANAHLFRTMHEDRKQVFVDTLNWDIPHDGVQEADQYDNDLADYLILRDVASGDHLGSVRLLPTTGSHMLADVFPFLCEGTLPRGPSVREITRLVVSPSVPVRDRLMVRNMLGRAMIEFGLEMGVTKYTAVCDFGFLTQLLSSGWHIKPLGMPQIVAGSLIGALQIRLDRHSLALTNEAWRHDMPVLRMIEHAPALVA